MGPGDSGVRCGKFRAGVEVFRFDYQPAAVRHGIPRIHRQVQYDLFDLPGLGAYRASIGAQDETQFDILPMMRRSIFSKSRMTSSMTIVLASNNRLRLKASSCRVNAVARPASLSISVSDSRRSSRDGKSSNPNRQ
jgi:hypothetical protein